MEDLPWVQFALVFWAAACLFTCGARLRHGRMTAAIWREVVEAAFIVVLLFALLTDGGGCRAGGPTIDEDAATCLGGRC